MRRGAHRGAGSGGWEVRSNVRSEDACARRAPACRAAGPGLAYPHRFAALNASTSTKGSSDRRLSPPTTRRVLTLTGSVVSGTKAMPRGSSWRPRNGGGGGGAAAASSVAFEAILLLTNENGSRPRDGE